VKRNVRVRRTRREILPDHQHRFSMRHRPGADETDIGCEREIARDAPPGKEQGILSTPDVRPPAGDAILATRLIEFDRTGLRGQADVSPRFEVYRTGELAVWGTARLASRRAAPSVRLCML